MILQGRVWVFGDDIDTDAIIPARYLTTIDPEELAAHCMEDADSGFASRVREGDVIIAGKNFGCGSSREHAPLAIKGAKISCVVAHSFARIFYRNAVNIGLPILECSANLSGTVKQGEQIKIDLDKGLIYYGESSYEAAPFPPFMQEIMRRGGLIEYVRHRIRQM